MDDEPTVWVDTTSLIRQLQPGVASQLLTARRNDLAERSLSKRTRQAYRQDWTHFTTWLQAHGLCTDALRTPENTDLAVSVYLEFHLRHPAPEQRLRPSTMRRRLIGIRHHARVNGVPWPADDSSLLLAVDVAQREIGSPPRRAAPISVPLLRQMVNLCDDDPLGRRDRALLLTGYCSGLRRSELVALDVNDITFEPEGVRIQLRASKTDQERQGRDVHLRLGVHRHTCPVSALRSWLAIRHDDGDPLLTSVARNGRSTGRRLTGDVVDRVVRSYAERAQPGPRYSAHSLRAGLATAAAKGGADPRTIMRQTGHRSLAVLESYVRSGTGYQENVMRYLDV